MTSFFIASFSAYMSQNRQMHFSWTSKSFEPALYILHGLQLFLQSIWNKIESQTGSLCSAVPSEGQIQLTYINDVEELGSHLYATCRGHEQAGVVP
jgi:hypothetical protein